MPVHASMDDKGCYAQWGNSGKKYYYKCGDEKAKNEAKRKANVQGYAVEKSGWKENK